MRPGSHPPRSLPCIDLSFGHRPAEQSPGTADGRFQVGCIKRARGVGCRLQSRDDFPIEAAMMFLGTFFWVSGASLLECFSTWSTATSQP